MKIKNTIGETVFDISNHVFLGLMALVSIFPFYYMMISSITPSQNFSMTEMNLLPKGFTLDNYHFIMQSPDLIRSFFVSVFLATVGTIINLIMQFTMGYSLSDSDLTGRKFFMKMVVFTMLFSGGMIPTYLIVKSMGLRDTIWSLIIPGVINPFNLILAVNFLKQIPPSMKESARLDGANDLRILWSIILPLSKPALATFAIFYAVGHWNSYFDAIIYINNPKLRPIQLLLRGVIMQAQALARDGNLDSENSIPTEGLKMAVILVATLPILLVYPFFQKHFTKGLMAGSMKG